MRCPACGCPDDKVIDSRLAKDGTGVRRRRECLKCAYRFSTYESIIPEGLRVIKRNQEREDFDRDKLRAGIANACYKRPVSAQAIQKTIDAIELEVFNREEKEIPSSVIGEIVMEKLKDLDPVAYVRFASVYREFKDANTFMDELKKFLQ